MMIVKFLVVLVASVALDWLFARWTQAVVSKRAGKATSISGLYYALSAACTVCFVGEPWLIAPTVVGHMIGTFVALK